MSNKKRRLSCNNGCTTMLPKDMLVEVVTRIASHSFVDFHYTKECCKDFLEASEDNHVYQHVCMDRIPLIEWFPNEKVTSFMNRCRANENLGCLYREGLKEYFNFPNGIVEGLEKLKITAEKGYKEAQYVYGMILLCSKEQELRNQGLEYMRFLRKSKCVITYRNKAKKLLGNLWRSDEMLLVRNRIPLCSCKDTCDGWKVKKGVWSLLNDEDDDMSSCEYCRWDYELDLFFQMFNL